MDHQPDKEDKVVRELDIYVCNGLLGSSTNLYLFQYPLRAPWRPYGGEREMDTIRIKPGVKKVEMEVPIETMPENNNHLADAKMQLQKHRLTSSRVELKTTYAVGSVRGDKVLLSQLDHALQMRPSLNHMDTPEAQKEKAKKSSAEEQPDQELKAVQVWAPD